MNRGRTSLTRDLPRKMLALGLALFVWWSVHQNIRIDETREFEIVTDLAEATENRTILVTVPRGWQLVTPKPGTLRAIKLKGVREEIQNFVAGGVRAEFKVDASDVDSSSAVSSVSLNVEVGDIDWPDRIRADRLLSLAGNEPIKLDIQRLETIPFALRLEDISLVENEPFPEDIKLAIDELSFFPNTVQISGPIGALNGINKPVAGDRDLRLFAELELAPRRDDVRLAVQLSPEAVEAGLRMAPPLVELHIPVYRRPLEPFILAPPAEIELTGEPTDPGTTWEFNSYGGCTFRVEYTHHEDIDPIPTANELRDAIQFFVHLDDLPPGSTTGAELQIDWNVRDRNDLADHKRQQALKRAVKLIPQSPEPETRAVRLNKID